MKRIKLGLCLAAMVITLTLASGTAMALASWDSFGEAVFSGITVEVADGGLSYVLTLSGTPKVTVGGTTFDVTWCQGFFLLDPTGADTISASQGTTPAGWSYETKPGEEPFNVVGWTHEPADGRLLPTQSATFTLGSLSAPAGTIYGYHLGYAKADGTMGLLTVTTEHFKDAPVPEPGSLVVAATMLAGMVGFIRRRRVT